MRLPPLLSAFLCSISFTSHLPVLWASAMLCRVGSDSQRFAETAPGRWLVLHLVLFWVTSPLPQNNYSEVNDLQTCLLSFYNDSSTNLGITSIQTLNLDLLCISPCLDVLAVGMRLRVWTKHLLKNWPVGSIWALMSCYCLPQRQAVEAQCASPSTCSNTSTTKRLCLMTQGTEALKERPQIFSINSCSLN